MSEHSTPLSAPTKQIEIVGGHFATVDACDYDLLRQFRWNIRRKNGLEYAATSATPRKYMHRLILGAVRGQIVDHRDGNGLNNTRANLRIATHRQNIQNQKIRNDSHNPYKGIQFCRWVRCRNKWRAVICVKGCALALGLYGTPEEAAAAYNAAAVYYFGEFARLNTVSIVKEYDPSKHRERLQAKGILL